MSDEQYIPRYVLDFGLSEVFIEDRLTRVRSGFASPEIVTELFHRGISVIEADPVGLGLPWIQQLQERWPGTVVVRRQNS